MRLYATHTRDVILSREDGEGSRNRSARSAFPEVGHAVTATDTSAHRGAFAPPVRSFAVFAAQDDALWERRVAEELL